MASAEPLYHSGPVRCCAGTLSTNCPSIELSRHPREMCVFSDSDLYCVSTFMRSTPELAKFERTKSMMRYRPPNVTAGLDRSWVRGARRRPSPPARIMARVFPTDMRATVAPRAKCCNGAAPGCSASGGPLGCGGLRGLRFRGGALLRNPVPIRELADDLVHLVLRLAHQLGAVMEGEERALEAGHQDVADVVRGQPELPGDDRQLLGHAGVGDQAVVGIDRHPDPEVQIELERVRRHVRDGAGLDVAGGAAFDRNAVVVHVIEEIAVLAQPHAMPDAVRSAVVQRLGDGGRAIRLAGVDGAVDVVVQDELKRALMVLGGIPVLGAGEIEAEHPPVLVRDGELGEPQRGVRAHVADATDQHTRENARLPRRRAQTLDDRLA